MEDLLRSLELWKLPNAPPEALAKIPLAEPEEKAEKFNLSGLGKFRGQTINDLIESSVREHLERISYNNVGQVTAALSRIGIDPAKLEQHFSKIEPVMARRHRIVHRADANENAGSGQHRGLNDAGIAEDSIPQEDGVKQELTAETPSIPVQQRSGEPCDCLLGLRVSRMGSAGTSDTENLA